MPDKDNNYELLIEELNNVKNELKTTKEEVESLKVENKNIIEFNRSLLKVKPADSNNKNVDIKDKLTKYLSEE